MENYLSPGDPLFRILEVVGVAALTATILIGVMVSYDWWKEKQEKEREEQNGQGR